MSETALDIHRIVYHRGSVVYARFKAGPPGDYRHPLDVPNGLACGCVCDECAEDLQARANDQEKLAAKEYRKIPHFSHQSNTKCAPSGERGLAEAFRVAFERLGVITLPEARFGPDAGEAIGRIFKASESKRVTSCALVPRLSGNPYELLLNFDEECVRLLIIVGRLSPSIEAAAKQQPVPTLAAFMVPDFNGSIYMEDILNVLNHGQYLSWIWLPEMEAAIAEERMRQDSLLAQKQRERLEKEATQRKAQAVRQAEFDIQKKAEQAKIDEAAKAKGLVKMLCSSCHEHTAYAKPPDISMQCPICRRYTFFFPI